MKEEEMQILYDKLRKIRNKKDLPAHISSYKKSFDVKEPPETAVSNSIDALFYYAIVFTIPDSVISDMNIPRIKWQHYWLKCCLSEKCDYVFTILGSKKFAGFYCEDIGISRENDLLKIMTNDSIWQNSTSEAKRYYMLLSINFLLRRYNWIDAFRLCNKLSSKTLNCINLFFPRIISAILVGYLAITTSDNIYLFASANMPKLISYCCFMLLASVSYLFFECSKKNQWILSTKNLIYRVAFVFIFGLVVSLIFSVLFVKVGLLDPTSFSGQRWCWNKIFFYSTLAYFIGIIVQLLWEDKTVTEPL